jgi:glycosyltransferase involved in cell wall biosynthesis
VKLSLVIPAYNEAENLPLLLPRCADLAAARPGTEIVIVDNGSHDDTPAVLADLLPRHPGCRSIRVPVNRGFGYGVLEGLHAATGDLLAWTHADMQTDPCDALNGMALFDRVGDPARLFVKGRRYGRPAADVVFTVGMSAFETLLLARPFWDINAQPVMFHRDFFATWRQPPHDFALDLYAYYAARRAGFDIRRIPVHFGARAHGASHWNVDWKAKMAFIRRTIDYSLRLRRRLSAI